MNSPHQLLMDGWEDDNSNGSSDGSKTPDSSWSSWPSRRLNSAVWVPPPSGITNSGSIPYRLFNDDDKLTMEQIQERLHLPQDDTVRALHSLACAKYKILLKEPAGKTVS